MGLGKLAVEALSAGAYLIDDFAGNGLRALGFSSPEAVEKLAKAGEKTKFGYTPRTIQGPLPPPSVRSPMDQQRFDPVMPSREEAILSGSTRYMKDGEIMMNRNYGAEYKPLGQPRRQVSRQSENNAKPRAAKAAQQTDPNAPIFKEGRMDFQEIRENPDVTYEAHHRAGLEMYNWAFKGLDEQGQAEMRALLESMGVFTGDSMYNRMDLPKVEVHEPLHTRSLKNAGDIENLGEKLIQRYPGWEFKSVKERAGLIKHFVKTVQRYADTETYRMMSQRRALSK